MNIKKIITQKYPEQTVFDTLIIGGGPAGILCGYFLKKAGLGFTILDKGPSIGHSWESRYDSLRLDSFARYLSFPAFSFLKEFKTDKHHQPSKNEVSDFLRAFSEKNLLSKSIIHNTEIMSLEKEVATDVNNREIFKAIDQNQKTYFAKKIIVCTGAFHNPRFSRSYNKIKEAFPKIIQLHSSQYKNSSELLPGKTAIIGSGNSGCEIALELADAEIETTLFSRSPLKTTKNSHFNQFLAYIVGIAHLPRKSIFGRFVVWMTSGKSVGIDIKKLMNSSFVDIKYENVDDIEISSFSDFQNIIWCTGFEQDFYWIKINSLIEKDSGLPFEKRGVCKNVKNIYFLGLRWQYSKSSSHLTGLVRDAKYLVKKIIKINA